MLCKLTLRRPRSTCPTNVQFAYGDCGIRYAKVDERQVLTAVLDTTPTC